MSGFKKTPFLSDMEKNEIERDFLQEDASKLFKKDIKALHILIPVNLYTDLKALSGHMRISMKALCVEILMTEVRKKLKKMIDLDMI